MTHVDGAIDILALSHTGEEAGGECITGAGGVDNLFGIDLVDWVALDRVFTLDGDDGRVRALGDDGDALAPVVLLGQVCQMFRDGLDVVRLEVV